VYTALPALQFGIVLFTHYDFEDPLHTPRNRSKDIKHTNPHSTSLSTTKSQRTPQSWPLRQPELYFLSLGTENTLYWKKSSKACRHSTTPSLPPCTQSHGYVDPLRHIISKTVDPATQRPCLLRTDAARSASRSLRTIGRARHARRMPRCRRRAGIFRHELSAYRMYILTPSPFPFSKIELHFES
jgi:hypothetical protein